MVHVHVTSALLNSNYAPLLKAAAPAADEVNVLNEAIGQLQQVATAVEAKFPVVSQVAPVSRSLRSAVFLLADADVRGIVSTVAALPFVVALVERALSEVRIFVKHGIRCVEIENVGAPYFVGSGACPWEELLVMHIVIGAVRAEFPNLAIGAHILSANELEVLPIAICHGAFFVRSEATVFGGVRPEGPVPNHSNLARYMYVRHQLRCLANCATEADCRAPQVWSDLIKKHTVFMSELSDIHTWLHNVTFMKLEGVILTGLETGSDVDERSLIAARKEIASVKAFNRRTYPDAADDALPELPVVTGSGLNFSMYARYADFIIVGTALKKQKYWENEVDEENVAATVKMLGEANEAAKGMRQ